MCMPVDYAETNIYKQKTGTIDVYKVYVKSNRYLLAPFYANNEGKELSGGIIRGPGNIISDRIMQYIDGSQYDGCSYVYHGIHVYLTDEKAKKEWYAELVLRSAEHNRILVKLQADCSDLVAIGKHSFDESATLAVFMKVYLPQDEWDKIWR